MRHHFQLAEYYYHRGKYEEAKQEYLKELSLDSSHVDARFALVNVYSHLGQKNAMIAELNKVIELESEGREADFARTLVESLEESIRLDEEEKQSLKSAQVSAGEEKTQTFQSFPLTEKIEAAGEPEPEEHEPARDVLLEPAVSRSRATEVFFLAAMLLAGGVLLLLGIRGMANLFRDQSREQVTITPLPVARQNKGTLLPKTIADPASPALSALQPFTPEKKIEIKKVPSQKKPAIQHGTEVTGKLTISVPEGCADCLVQVVLVTGSTRKTVFSGVRSQGNILNLPVEGILGKTLIRIYVDNKHVKEYRLDESLTKQKEQ